MFTAFQMKETISDNIVSTTSGSYQFILYMESSNLLVIGRYTSIDTFSLNTTTNTWSRVNTFSISGIINADVSDTGEDPTLILGIGTASATTPIVRVYKWNGSSWTSQGTWNKTEIGIPATAGDYLAWVKIHGDRFVVTTPGLTTGPCRSYTRSTGTWSFEEEFGGLYMNYIHAMDSTYLITYNAQSDLNQLWKRSGSPLSWTVVDTFPSITTYGTDYTVVDFDGTYAIAITEGGLTSNTKCAIFKIQSDTITHETTLSESMGNYGATVVSGGKVGMCYYTGTWGSDPQFNRVIYENIGSPPTWTAVRTDEPSIGYNSNTTGILTSLWSQTISINTTDDWSVVAFFYDMDGDDVADTGIAWSDIQ